MANAEAGSDPMKGCSISYPKIDESELLADVRSPRFLLACRKLQIDPLELRTPAFASFKDKSGSLEKQQVRFAMYERARFQKWRALNDCRSSMPTNDSEPKRSRSVEPALSRSLVSNSWLGTELSKTGPILQRGKTEVFMCCFKNLKEIATNGSLQSQTSVPSNDEVIRKQRDKRKEFLKKQNAAIAKRKEKAKKTRELNAERDKLIKEQEDAEEGRRVALLESWKQEAEAKRKAQIEHFQVVHSRLKKSEQEKEEQAQRILEEMRRKEEAVKKKQEDSRPFTSPNMTNIPPHDLRSPNSTSRAAAQWRREQAHQRALEHSRQLMAEFKKQQVEFERKTAEKRDREKDLAKSRKAKESEVRKKIASIRKRAKEDLKERTERIRDHLLEAEQKAARRIEETRKALEVKAEMERLQFEQAQEKLQRQKAIRLKESAELDAMHQQISRDKEERDRILQELLRERQQISTNIRLQKSRIQDEITQIQKSKTWNRAAQLIQELEPNTAP